MRKAAVLNVNTLETLLRQHRQWDERIKELVSHSYLTVSEQNEVRELKKLKLAAKDRIIDLEQERSRS